MKQMVQWFKNLFKKKSVIPIEYNQEVNLDTINRGTLHIHSNHTSELFKTLESVFTASRNIALLELAKSDDKTFMHLKGRLSALQDVVDYFELCKDSARCEKLRVQRKAARGATLHSFKKPLNT